MSDVLKFGFATALLIALVAAIGLAALSYPSETAIDLVVNLFVGLAAFAAPIGLACGGRIRWFTIGFSCTAFALIACSLAPSLRPYLFTEMIIRDLWGAVFSKAQRVMPPDLFHLTAHLILSLMLGCLSGFVTQLINGAMSSATRRS